MDKLVLWAFLTFGLVVASIFASAYNPEETVSYSKEIVPTCCDLTEQEIERQPVIIEPIEITERGNENEMPD